MIKQSFSWWCFVNRGLGPEELIAGAAQAGYHGVDLVAEKFWPVVRKHGLEISAINGHGTLTEGLNHMEYAERIEGEIRANIAKAVEWKIPVLICLTGNRAGISEREGLENSAEQLSRVAPVAADAGVLLAVELLNSKVDHKDYQCDHTAWGVELIKQVNSPAVKLLYDIYHMQIMEGDLIRTIKAEHEHIGHYHTAGNPGRGQPDETQEIYYPPIYKAIAATGYDGYISHEFIPSIHPVEAMEKAFKDCEAALSGR
jgi:hydroxypyruvate isomerase